MAIIDAADDLNANAANAVLKTLEEPPARGMLFLISHAPGRLLPTIRSRCRRLRFAPPEAESGAAWVASKAGVGADEARRLLAMARGAPGRAWALAAAGALAIDEAARELLDSLPAVGDAAALALADGFRGAEGAERFNLLFDRLADQVHTRCAEQAANGQGGGRAAAWAEAWSLLTDLPRQAEGINLDRADAFFTVLTRLTRDRSPC